MVKALNPASAMSRLSQECWLAITVNVLEVFWESPGKRDQGYSIAFSLHVGQMPCVIEPTLVCNSSQESQ